MKNVEILLREHVENLGRCGDVVRVRPGYARNYLLPRKLAVVATEDNKKLMVRRRARLDAEEVQRDQELEVRLSALTTVALRTSQKADESGRLYGSVNAAAIVDLLRIAGFEFEEADVRLEAPIKAVGSHTVRVHVHGERFAEIGLEVSSAD
ncbi:MAG TPA: 50S ribosomal protein L9 [Planctomycetota bacterium]|nr:50S ribosomal protein L9 [Planctomycetota bacterium]